MPELEPYRINTEVIPPHVDIHLAGARADLIEAYRRGESGAQETLRRLFNLYWSTQSFADDVTRHYLMDATIEFPLEADIDLDLVDKIYRETGPQY